MDKEITVQQDFVIPNEYNDYKYVAFISQTSSQKYDLILYTIKQYPNIEFLSKNKLWHIVGFQDTLDDIKGLFNLLQYTEGLKNVYFYNNGVLTTSLRHYIGQVMNCLQNTIKLKNTSLYCQEISNDTKEKIDNPLSFSINLTENNTTKFKHIQAVKQIFPCNKISKYNFNPYENKDNIKEAYLAYALKTNPGIVNHCPLFNINNYSCEFIEETVVV